jgi:very-short-patch-repair endonuclease
MTDTEAKVWSYLRGNNLGLKIRRQVPFGPYILDFFCAKARLCIALDGSQHYTVEGMQRDEKRDAFLRSEGVEVLRFSDRDALQDTKSVVGLIYEKVQLRLRGETPSYPSPKRGRDM